MENKQSFEEVLNRDGRLVYTNVGVSMLPLIREGRDVMIIEKRDISAVKKYDAVLYRRDNFSGRGRYVLHRIVKILPDGSYYIVGDNATSGETVNAGQILGVLTGINRGGRQVSLTGFKHRAYVALWCAPYHLRFAILHIKHFLSYLFGAVLYKLKIRR